MDRGRFGAEGNRVAKGFSVEGKGATEPEATDGDNGAGEKAGKGLQNQAASTGKGNGRPCLEGAPRKHEGRGKGRTSRNPPASTKEA